MIKREVDMTKKLDHPNICRVYNVVEDVDKIYMIIDQLNGRSLYEHIFKKNVINEKETAAIASQIVSCLKYLHKNNVLLRRIKLETIIFAENDSQDDLRLTDLMFSTSKKNLQYENPFLIDEIFVPPDSNFQGAVKFIPVFNH